MLDSEVQTWTAAESADLYQIERWGGGYFHVDDAGHLRIHPSKQPDRSIDVKQLIDRLSLQGVATPVLVRVGELLQHRLGEIHDAFAHAIDEYDYDGRYACIYPIKVNQQRQVVEEVLSFGAAYEFGLEAGSKPELLAVLSLATQHAVATGIETPIICNGFKDARYIETALAAQKIGRQVTLVVEKLTELELILSLARKVGVRPQIGMRVKLAGCGSGRWKSSGGHRSKFGLTSSEILSALKTLREWEMVDCFKLLHFHLGSQVTNIRRIKSALLEVARVYTELVKQGARLEYLNVGGGLGVDYDGSQTNYESSMNYTLQEYANDVVSHIQSVCDEVGCPHPTILSESGRAAVAYHSVLVFNVLDVSRQGAPEENGSSGELNFKNETLSRTVQPVLDLIDTHENLSQRNVLESYHDAQQAYDMSIELFRGGFLPLAQRSFVENLFWAICRKIARLSKQMEYVPEELEGLEAHLADTYYCNFSLFQSIPDSWAIKQLFPVMPIHRLEEEPTQLGVLADITCDSDGKIDRFVDLRDVRRTLPLHSLSKDRSEPYYLAAFLVGAYQEILGDLHNLFGDTNAVHVRLNPEGDVEIDTLVEGDRVANVLDYVQFNSRELGQELRAGLVSSIAAGQIAEEDADRFLDLFEEGLRGYTYLDDSPGSGRDDV